ncbi:hypothetical protein [Leisingera sp. HS039]|uniref:hypothetical protein n=1 Tax=Leisingera sp. HS039 TaxID=2818496 RepID=UPI0024949647|nr:hypothetical protein [Leisingera sp. HS039]
MVHGETPINTRGMDPRRYGNFSTGHFIVERTKDEFMRRHDTPCPGKQFNSLRPLNRHVLFDRLAAKGRFETEITIWRIAEDRYFTGSPIARANSDFDWIKSHIREGEDVQMVNRSHD